MNDNKLTFAVIFAIIIIPVIAILIYNEVKWEKEWSRQDMVSKIRIDNISRSIERTTEYYADERKETQRKYEQEKARLAHEQALDDAETALRLAELELEAARMKEGLHK